MGLYFRVAASIVTYRSNVYQLRKAVDSFLEVNLATHLTIVDNDSGADYVASLRTFGQCELMDAGANGGFGFGHNIAIERAHPCDYYLVLNPDVEIKPGALEKMVDYLDDNLDIGLLVPRVKFPHGEPQYLNKRLPSVLDLFLRRFAPGPLQNIAFIRRRMERYEMRDVGYDYTTDVPFCSGCFMLFRKSVLDQVGPFDERFFMYLEDCDMTRRVVLAGHRAVYFPHAVIVHHWMRGSHKSLRLMVVMIQSMFAYFSKWGWKWL